MWQAFCLYTSVINLHGHKAIITPALMFFNVDDIIHFVLLGRYILICFGEVCSMQLSTIPSQKIIRESWHSFIHGSSRNLAVRPEILRAWIRCSEKGISPYISTAPRLPEEAIARRLKINAELISVGKPAVDSLYQFIAGTGFAVSLSDPEGCFLYVKGDEATISASQGSVEVGAVWSENAVGANSIGTAIHDDQPIQMFGYEHYSKLSQRWAGSGCPIHNSDGKVIGTVDISGELENVHLHTLGMAVITARSIEMQLTLLKTSEQVELKNRYQRAIINSISEGLLVVNSKNRISTVNDILSSMLGSNANLLIGQDIATLLPDKDILQAVYKRTEFNDFITKIGSDTESLSCTMTARRIPLPNGNSDILLLVKEMVRAKKLAQRLQADEARLRFDDIVGTDMKLRSAIEIAATAAETTANVLILGESGTGKDVFAQAIHNGSSRRNGPYVAVNCGAIPRELIASTLFGYEEGAFTGAKRGGSIGKFELADGGTIFLDEIGEIPLDIQSVLLRVLETKRFSRVGGKSSIKVDIHVIAATNRDLLHEVQMRHFRQDLYFRLDVLSIHLPPLRERRGDIMPLVEHFLAQMSSRYLKAVTSFSPEAEQMLVNYSWPGNIRELQNIVERAVILTKSSEITVSLLSQLMTVLEFTSPATTEYENELTVPSRGNQAERDELLKLLNSCRWNLSEAAKRLGVARSTLYRRIDHYNLRDS